MKYKKAIEISMRMLSEDPRTFFIGYNLKFGSQGYGSLRDIPKEKIIEMPIAESLMAGLGMGLGIVGLRPVVIYERHDFILHSLDNIVNHLDKIEGLSNGEFVSPVLIRAIVGSQTPINPGPQHKQDFTHALKKMIKFPIYTPQTSDEVIFTYKKFMRNNSPCLVVEYRDFYEKE